MDRTNDNYIDLTPLLHELKTTNDLIEMHDEEKTYTTYAHIDEMIVQLKRLKKLTVKDED